MAPVHDWTLDELAHAGPEHLDRAYVERYERKAGYDPSDDVQWLRDRGLDSTSVVVDLGAGPGTFATAVAPWCRHVIAVDISPAMCATIRARVAARGQDNVRVVQAGFLSYRHDADPADVVFTRNALHQLPDFWKGIALHNVAGLLRAGGTLLLHDLVFDFEPRDAGARLEEWFAGAVGDPQTGYTADEFVTHVRTEFSTYRWLFEPVLEHAGFEIVACSFRNGIYATYGCTLRGRAPRSRDAL
jgi:ubiquinone/menaquinone biosynthesis C-methylase UbiE